MKKLLLVLFAVVASLAAASAVSPTLPAAAAPPAQLQPCIWYCWGNSSQFFQSLAVCQASCSTFCLAPQLPVACEPG